MITCPCCNHTFTPDAPATVGLTERQSNLLGFIRKYLSENEGVAPNYEEMKEFLGVGKTTVHHLIGELEQRGVIRRLPNKTRAISIIGGVA
jgi:repressor LexA